MTNSYKQEIIKVNINGIEGWFHQEENGSGFIAPLHHCFPNGELDFTKAFALSGRLRALLLVKINNMKYKKGDIVEIINWGGVYSTHEPAAKRLGLTKWAKGWEHPEPWQNTKETAEVIYHVDDFVGILFRGKQIIIDEYSINLARFKKTKIKRLNKAFKARLIINDLGKMDKAELKRLRAWIRKDLIRHVSIFLKVNKKNRQVMTSLM